MPEVVRRRCIQSVTTINDEFAEKIYTEYHVKVLRYISSRINNRDDAEDLASTVFLKVLNSYDSTRVGVSSWIYTITQNTVRDYLRKCKTQKTHTGYDENLEIIPFTDENVNGDSIIREEEIGQLADALELLSERERDIIIMRYYKELSPKEIAEAMNISYSNVRFINHCAISKLRDILADKDD